MNRLGQLCWSRLLGSLPWKTGDMVVTSRSGTALLSCCNGNDSAEALSCGSASPVAGCDASCDREVNKLPTNTGSVAGEGGEL